MLRGLSLGKRALQKFKDSSLRSKGPIKRAEDPFSDSEVEGFFGISEQRASVTHSKDPVACFGPLGSSMDPSVASGAHR